MSFFFPNPAATVVGALDRGLQFDSEAGAVSTDWAGASQLLADNFSALEDYTASQATALLQSGLDGSGNAIIAHGISTPFGLLSAQAWYKGPSAVVFKPCTVQSVDDVNVVVVGGGAGQPVRVFLVYSIVPPGW